jgi:hypothetical protein
MTDPQPEPAALPTLDGLFRRTLAQVPGRLALCDPFDKVRVTGTAPLRLTYAEADRAIAALAAHFIAARLPQGSIVALQLPNTVEATLAVLAASRAGLVAALLPQLWRGADLGAALNRIGARAIVTCGEIDGVDHADLAMNAAVETFSIRHVCGFGANLPDGMVALDEALALAPAAVPALPEEVRRAAVITFDVTTDGLRVVPRSHAAMIAGGLVIDLESRLPQRATIAAAVTPSSFGTLAASLVTWLLTGGTLALHHPFAPDGLLRQLAEMPCDTLIAPAPLALDLATQAPTLRHVIGLWRAPEQIAASSAWTGSAAFTDVALFGEIGLVAMRRGADGLPAAIPAATSPETSDDVRLTAHGTLALGGPMVPVVAYHGTPTPDDSPPAEVDTGYAARRAAGGLTVTAPPAGLIGVGGYRFRSTELQTWSRMLPPDTTLTAVPDRFTGHRLAGHAGDRLRTRQALIDLGLNPLVAEAFRTSGEADKQPADVDVVLTPPG